MKLYKRHELLSDLGYITIVLTETFKWIEYWTWQWLMPCQYLLDSWIYSSDFKWKEARTCNWEYPTLKIISVAIAHTNGKKRYVAEEQWNRHCEYWISAQHNLSSWTTKMKPLIPQLPMSKHVWYILEVYTMPLYWNKCLVWDECLRVYTKLFDQNFHSKNEFWHKIQAMNLNKECEEQSYSCVTTPNKVRSAIKRHCRNVADIKKSKTSSTTATSDRAGKTDCKQQQ